MKPDSREAKRRYARLVDAAIGRPLEAQGFSARTARWVRGNPHQQIACAVATQRSIERDGNIRFTVNWGIGGVPLQDIPTGRTFTPSSAAIARYLATMTEPEREIVGIADALATSGLLPSVS